MPKANPPDLDALRREIRADRERIADMVAALAYRANVPARIREDVSDRIAAAKRSAFGAPASDAPLFASDALQPGDEGDDAAMIAAESAADVVEALDDSRSFPRATLRYVERNRLLFAIGAFAAFVALALSIAARRGKPDGHDTAA